MSEIILTKREIAQIRKEVNKRTINEWLEDIYDHSIQDLLNVVEPLKKEYNLSYEDFYVEKEWGYNNEANFTLMFKRPLNKEEVKKAIIVESSFALKLKKAKIKKEQQKKTKEEKERAEYERLKKKFEGGKK